METTLGSPDMMPSASVTKTISSALRASARMNAVVSLPPLPSVVILPSMVLPTNPAMTGTVPFSTMGSTFSLTRVLHSSSNGLAFEKAESVTIGQSLSSGSK